MFLSLSSLEVYSCSFLCRYDVQHVRQQSTDWMTIPASAAVGAYLITLHPLGLDCSIRGKSSKTGHECIYTASVPRSDRT